MREKGATGLKRRPSQSLLTKKGLLSKRETARGIKESSYHGGKAVGSGFEQREKKKKAQIRRRSQ